MGAAHTTVAIYYDHDGRPSEVYVEGQPFTADSGDLRVRAEKAEQKVRELTAELAEQIQCVEALKESSQRVVSERDATIEALTLQLAEAKKSATHPATADQSFTVGTVAREVAAEVVRKLAERDEAVDGASSEPTTEEQSPMTPLGHLVERYEALNAHRNKLVVELGQERALVATLREHLRGLVKHAQHAHALDVERLG